ncbi:MAG: putative amidohydrolase [Parasphingorhabdus sp.]|jgi:predicted amidohydrolase
MKTGIFQSAAHGQSANERITRLESYIEKQDLDLIVCPELFLSGYNIGNELNTLAEAVEGESSNRIAELARRHQTAIIYGYPENSNGETFNSALCIDSKGRIVANHRKLLLPPGFEANHFAGGNTLTLFDLNGIRCAILICYDCEYPESVRAVAESGAKIIIVPTALSDQWGVVAEKLIPSRAFENGVWMVYANHAGSENGIRYFGGSCIVNPTGNDAARADSTESFISTDIDIAAVDRAQKRLPYVTRATELRALLNISS